MFNKQLDKVQLLAYILSRRWKSCLHITQQVTLKRVFTIYLMWYKFIHSSSKGSENYTIQRMLYIKTASLAMKDAVVGYSQILVLALFRRIFYRFNSEQVISLYIADCTLFVLAVLCCSVLHRLFVGNTTRALQ